MRSVLVGVALVAACASASPTTSTLSSACGPVRWGPIDAPTWVSMGSATNLTVFVDGATVPIAGSMGAHPRDRRPVFRTQFPLTPALRYRVRSLGGCEATFAVAPLPSNRPAARAVAIYPTADALPANILRFYVYFAQPMAEGAFLDHVRLTHVESGQDLSGVFFDNIYELWSADRKRITLLVDPGRVKTGLQAHAVRGRAFTPGQTYALHIESSWPTIDGRPLAKGFTKIFQAAEPVRKPVDPRRWRLDLPNPGTRQPLRVDFIEPVDHVSVSHFVQVQSAEGEPIGGRWLLAPGERQASWTPHRPWAPAIDSHRLVVVGRFEDIAGNNVNAAFDHHASAFVSENENQTVTVVFGPAAAKTRRSIN